MDKHSMPPDFVFPQRLVDETGKKRPPYKPQGTKFPHTPAVFQIIGRPTKYWSYSYPYSSLSTWVCRYDRPNLPKKYRVITNYKGGWYVDYPPVPHMLYGKHLLLEAETVFVCEGEKATDAARSIGFYSTTSMGGPHKAADSDWTTLEEKHVVIIRDFDDDGLKYAQDVAQLVLKAGAYSARIVTLPGLNVGEDIVEWIAHHGPDTDGEELHAEILALVEAAPHVERQTTTPVVIGATVPDTHDESLTQMTTLDSVSSRRQEWVWEYVIPERALTLIIGEPGVGKSRFTLEVIAAVTRGTTVVTADTDEAEGLGGAEEKTPHPRPRTAGTQTPLPGSRGEGIERSGGSAAAVLLFADQDDLETTVRPRLEAAGADLAWVYTVNPGLCGDAVDREGEIEKSSRSIAPGYNSDSVGLETSVGHPMSHWERQLSILETELQRLQRELVPVRLIVIDPLRSFVGLNSKGLDPDLFATRLTRLATRAGVAIVVAAETGRTLGNAIPTQRSTTLQALMLSARSVWMIARDLDERKRRLLLPVKTNLSDDPDGMAYTMKHGRVRWEPASVSLTSDEFVVNTMARQRRALVEGDSNELNRVTNWLKEQLSQGPVLSSDIRKDARENDIRDITLRRALNGLGGETGKDKETGKWYWRLPAFEATSVEAPDVESSEVESSGNASAGFEVAQCCSSAPNDQHALNPTK
jgi:putative DNA primase/helicase